MKKKSLFAIVALGVVTLVGATFAINNDWAVFDNNFSLADARTEFVESFESPSNWTPCDETAKTVIATNRSDTKVAVRLKYEEYWKTANSTDTTHTTELPLEKDGSRLTEIILQNQNDWELKDGWYYWKGTLDKDGSTNSLLKSVKLACGVNFGGQNVCRDTDDGRICEKAAQDYDGAKYHVDVTVQTIQADSAKAVWDYDIPENNGSSNSNEPGTTGWQKSITELRRIQA